MNYYGYVDYRTVLDNQSMNVFHANEAFTKGTIFKTLYIPYKNFLPKQPVALTDKQKSMLEVQKYCSVCHDFALYLDVFPNDKNVISLRNEYLEKYEKALDNYQSKYGSIVSSNATTVPYDWRSTDWPWEVTK